MKKNMKRLNGLRMVLMMAAAGTFSAFADWVPSTGGTYDYGLPANWTGGVSNNVFLPLNYSGAGQTITIASDAVWNANTPVVTAHTNVTALILKATGSDRNLTLAGGVTYQGVTAGEKNNQIQFGTVTANEKINFTLPQTVTIQANSDACWFPRVIFNGVMGGAGGLNKTGHGSLYLQNAASTFTGTLNIGAGQVVLATASTTLSATNIVIGRQDALFKNSLPAQGVIGLLALGNGPAYAPVGTSVGATGANGNRIPDTAIVDMRGANIRLTAQDGDNSSLTETIGTVKLTRGVNGLTLSPPSWGTNNVVTLAISSLIRMPGTGLTAMNGANWNLTGNGTFGTGATVEGRVTLGAINGTVPESSVINGIIPWAVSATQISGYYWATIYHGNFLTYGTYGLTPVTTFVTDINTAGPTDNVKITAANPKLSTDRTVNSLTLYTTAAAAGQLDGTNTLTLASGAVNLCFAYNPHGGRLTIVPHLNFNGREGIFFVHQGPYQLNGALSNTGGNGLTVNFLGNNNNGAASLWLNTANTYTGPTTINGGQLRVWNGTIPAASPVVVNEGGGIDMREDNLTLASLAGMGYVWFQNATASGSKTLTVGSDNTSTTYAGTILNNGPLASGIIGSVVKTGTGTWTLSGTNGYTGPTTVNGGFLRVWNGAIPAASPVVVNEGGGIDMRLSSVALASLTGKGAVWFQYWDAGSGNTTLTVGSDNTSTTFAGTILNNGPSYSGVIGSMIKTGTGTWTLSGTNGYTGATTVSGGGLVVDGALAVTTNIVTVQTGTFLGGTGTVARTVTVNTGGLLTAGLTNTVGTLNIGTNLNLQAGAVLDVQLTDTNSYDRIVVGGTVNLNSTSGAGSVLQLRAPETLTRGQQFTIIDNPSTNAVQGTFSSGAHISSGGNTFAISYTGGTGNDVVLTVLPKGTQIRVW